MSKTSNTGTFVLGLGAQKSGTSWLFRTLADMPNADFGCHKEYHIWDAVHVSSCHEARVVPDWRMKLRNAVCSEAAPDWLVCRETVRWRMQNRNGYYEDYFRRRLGPNLALVSPDT